jgi:AsmA protein
MKRMGRLRRRLAAALVAPVAIWVLIVALLPTGWARDRLVRAIEARTGRAVRIERVVIGPFGAVHLRGLALAERSAADRPWAEAVEIRVQASARALLSGRLQARHVLVRGLDLRVDRAEGGDFVFRDLCCVRPDAGDDADGAGAGDHGDRSIRWTLADSRVTIDDAPTGTRLAISAIGGEGTWASRRVEVTRLIGLANGGRFAIQAEVERTPEGPTFETVLHAQAVGVNEGLHSLRMLAPVLAGSEVGLAGRMDLDLYLRGNATGAAALRRTAVGQGALRIDPVVLDRCVLVDELRGVLALPRDARVGSVRGQFAIAGGRVATRDLTLSVAGIPLVLEGATEFDGRLDYRLRTESLAGVIPAEIREALADLPLAVRDVLEVRVRGTADDLAVTLEGLPPMVDEQGRPVSDRERLRAVARRLRDRLFR